MPHGFPFPPDAAHLHGAQAGGSPPHRRRHHADARPARELPVGDLPAEPRRAHARDGDRRGARLPPRGVRLGPADADQRRHPAPAGAVARQRSAAHRAAQRAALLPPGHAGRLLRRRDWDGRQHLPRRSQRRANADAMDLRSQRRLLEGRPGTAVRAADHGCDLRLSGRQRRGAGAFAQLTAPLDEAAHRVAAAPSHVRPRHDSLSRARQPQGAGLRARTRRRADSVRRQSVAPGPAGRARPLRCRGPGAGGDARRHRVPPHRRPALRRDVGALWQLLVPPAGEGRTSDTRARRAPLDAQA